MKEIVIDSNIFIRFLVKDIKPQFERARELFDKIEKEENKGLVSILVLNEIIWILENFYELKREIYLPKLLNLLALKQIKVIEIKKDLIIKIFQEMQSRKFDFTDIYLVTIAESKKILSFDKDFKKLARKTK